MSIVNRVKGQLKALGTMPQNPLSVVAPLKPGAVAELQVHLATVNADTAGNGVLPLGVADECLHFARFLILDNTGKDSAKAMIFLANVDGSVEDFLLLLLNRAEQGVDILFQGCFGYPPPGQRNLASRLAFFRAHQVTAQAFYVNTLGRGVQQIQQEDRLHRALESYLDSIAPETFTSAREARSALIEHIRKTEDLCWALQPADGPGVLWRLKEHVRFAVVLGCGAFALFWTWPVLLGWLVTLQFLEEGDPEDQHRPTLDTLSSLRAAEDIAMHNQFSAVGELKPGLVRRWTARGVLALAQVALRHVFNRGDLAGIPLLGLQGVDTIHFARWILIDNDRRLLFASNYDGSLESYMVDFIDKVAWGLNAVFSNGRGFPRTRWLFFQGARDEQKFKDFIGNHQMLTQVWHAPYRHLTAVNIANNEAIRAGLRGHMSEKQAQAWLGRF